MATILDSVQRALKDAGTRARTMLGTGQLPPEQRALRAVRFPQQAEYLRVLKMLDRLSYEVAVDSILVLPRWSYERFVPLLKADGIRYVDVEVGSFRDLPPGKQAELRGLSGRRS